jgi:ribosome-associated protein
LRIPPGTTLGQALKAASLVGTGGEAKVLIQAGEVIEVGDERLEID